MSSDEERRTLDPKIRDFYEKRIAERERQQVLNLIWQGLYDCQDDASLKRGRKFDDHFIVQCMGKTFRVSIEHEALDSVRTEEEE